jgi:SET domain-containing protein
MIRLPRYETVPDLLCVVALRDIAPNEHLTIKYKCAPWW